MPRTSLSTLDLAANALYQRHCQAQNMYAKTWEALPAPRKEVWRAVANVALDLDVTTLRYMRPWQDEDRGTEIRELARLPLRERLRLRNGVAATREDAG